MEVINQKKEVSFVNKKNIFYSLDEDGNLKNHRPWLADIFSFLYDRIMEKSIFPKKFKGDINKHLDILKNEFSKIHNANILEISTGSGNAIFFLNKDNTYTGIDISSGLLKKAHSRFKESGFEKFELYNAAADKLPFQNSVFDFAFCNLSLNFFDDIELFISELKRVLKVGSSFFCSVPIPERVPAKSTIHGTLYSENELKIYFEKYDFDFESLPHENGALIYFLCRLDKNE